MQMQSRRSNAVFSYDRLACLIGGASLDRGIFADIRDSTDGFVGVDGGADHMLHSGITPDAVIGDLDSLSAMARRAFADVLHHVPDQSITDFEKALICVAAPVIIAAGFTGGRLDHSLSVLNVLARHAGRAVLLVDQDDVSFVAHHGLTGFTLDADTRLSVMPLDRARVTVTGLRWSFADQVMTPAGFTSPSNAALGGRVTIVTDGPVLVTLPRAHLQTALPIAARAG